MATSLLFSYPPVNFEFVNLEDTADSWVPDMSAFLNPQHVLSGIYFVSRECWLLDFYFLTRPSNSNMIRLRDAVDGWAPDVRLSKQEMCAC
jgi:hypothetical protein